MRIGVEEGDGYGLIRCSGILDRTAKTSIDETIHPLIEQGMHRLLIDLAEVPRITSEGVGLLVTLVSRANSLGGHIVFIHATPFVQAVFETTKINRFLEACDTAEEGVCRLVESVSKSEPI